MKLACVFLLGIILVNPCFAESVEPGVLLQNELSHFSLDATEGVESSLDYFHVRVGACAKWEIPGLFDFSVTPEITLIWASDEESLN